MEKPPGNGKATTPQINGMPVVFAICMHPSGGLAFIHGGRAVEALAQVSGMFEHFKIAAYREAIEDQNRMVQPAPASVLR